MPLHELVPDRMVYQDQKKECRCSCVHIGVWERVWVCSKCKVDGRLVVHKFPCPTHGY